MQGYKSELNEQQRSSTETQDAGLPTTFFSPNQLVGHTDSYDRREADAVFRVWLEQKLLENPQLEFSEVYSQYVSFLQMVQESNTPSYDTRVIDQYATQEEYNEDLEEIIGTPPTDESTKEDNGSPQFQQKTPNFG